MASVTDIPNGSVIPKIHRHPLQRIESPSRQISFVTHVLGLCSFAGSYWFLNAFPTPINASYGWHWQYLTIIGLLLATLTFIFGLLADITLSPRLFAAKNTLSLCSTPLEVLISVLYWSIVAYDRHLVIPPEFELNIWADISFHAVPSILLTWDLLALSPPWTIKNLPAVGLSAVLAFSYWGWVEHCYSHNGFYPYPLFELLTTTQRIGLFTGAAFVMTGSTVVLRWLYLQLNGNLGRSAKRASPANIKGKRT